MVVEELSPSEIRFTQDTISCKFQEHNGIEGGNCNEIIDKILRGEFNPNVFPPIKVVRSNGKMYTYDNRRLYVFRAVNYRRHRFKIYVRFVYDNDLTNSDHFTTSDDGKTVKVRYNRIEVRNGNSCDTYLHYNLAWLQPQQVSQPALRYVPDSNARFFTRGEAHVARVYHHNPPGRTESEMSCCDVLILLLLLLIGLFCFFVASLKHPRS